MPVPMLDCLQGSLVTTTSENTVAYVRVIVRDGTIDFRGQIRSCRPSIANTEVSVSARFLFPTYFSFSRPKSIFLKFMFVVAKKKLSHILSLARASNLIFQILSLRKELSLSFQSIKFYRTRIGRSHQDQSIALFERKIATWTVQYNIRHELPYYYTELHLIPLFSPQKIISLCIFFFQSRQYCST